MLPYEQLGASGVCGHSFSWGRTRLLLGALLLVSGRILYAKELMTRLGDEGAPTPFLTSLYRYPSPEARPTEENRLEFLSLWVEPEYALLKSLSARQGIELE